MSVTADADFLANPDSSDPINNGAAQIQYTREAVFERLAKELVTVNSGGTGSPTTDGWLRNGAAKAYYQASAPTTRPDGTTALTSGDNGRLWVDSDDNTQYVYIHPSWTEALNVNLAALYVNTLIKALASISASQAANKIPYFTGTGATSAAMLDFDVGTIATNSDSKIPSQKAVKTYVDNTVTGFMNLRGSTDCSGNPNYPSGVVGDLYVVSVAGKIGGASGTTVDIGDTYLCLAINAGGTQAAVGTSWTVLEHNLVNAGTVTSVGLALPAIMTVSNSPVTATGTLTGTLATQVANKVWAGPTTGADATPTFRALVAADAPGIFTTTEYVSNSSATDADDTASSVAGSGGSVGVIRTTTLTATRKKRVTFATALTATDQVFLEIYNGVGWIGSHIACVLNGNSTINTLGSSAATLAGMGIQLLSTTTADIVFGRYAQTDYTSTNTEWSSTNFVSGTKWRVRKVSYA